MTADALLLDLDGTLVDSGESIVRSWLRWAAEFNVDPALLAHAHGRTSAAIVAELVPADQLGHALARIDAIEIEDAGTVRAMDGAVELLSALPAQRWAIVTSGNATLAAARIAAAGLPSPATIVTADDITHGKPHPEPFLLAASLLGAEATRCVVVEDAPNGIAAARAAAMGVVGVTSTYPSAALDADLHVPSPSYLRVESTSPLSLAVEAP